METKKSLITTVLATAVLTMMVSCKKNDGTAANQPIPTNPQQIVIHNSGTLGAYLTDNQNHALYFFSKSDYSEGLGKTVYFTDGSGLTLYTFANDSTGENRFTSADFSNNHLFPIYETDKMVIPSSLNKTDFLAIQVLGRTQLSYKGWPLYNSAQDNATRGLNKAVSVPRPGVWPVAVKDVSAAP